MILHLPRLILSDVDGSVAQGTGRDTEAVERDVVIRLHVAFLEFVAADVGAVPIDFCNLFTASIQVNFEGTLSAGGRVFSTRVAPFVLLLAFDLGPLCAHGFLESII